MPSVLEAIRNGVVAELKLVEGFATYEGAPAVKAVPVTELFVTQQTEGGVVVDWNPAAKPDAYPGALVAVADAAVRPIAAENQRVRFGTGRVEYSAPVFVVIMTSDDGSVADAAMLQAWELEEKAQLRLMVFQPTVGVPDYASTEPLVPGPVESQPIDSSTHKIGMEFAARYALAV